MSWPSLREPAKWVVALSHLQFSGPRRILLAMATAALLGLNVPVSAAPPQEVPVLRIPKMVHPPTIDGRIEPGEWQSAAAITGFPNLNESMSLPQFLQPVWYVGYDDQNLYLAFRYPVYPKGSLRAAVKNKLDKEAAGGAILWDDHTEIEICNIGRAKAVSGYFYKFMTNPWDVVIDQKVRWSIGQMGFDYDTGAIAKSHFTASYWEQEIAIPLKSLGTSHIQDGTHWVMQLVSAQDSGGSYWTWAPATWLDFPSFPEVIFDSKAAAVQFTGVGDWMDGNPDLAFHVFNPQAKDIRLKVAAKIVAADGKVLLDRTDPVTVAPGASRQIQIKATGLALEDPRNGRNNRVYLQVTDADTGALYYRNDLTLWRSQNPDVQGYIKNLSVTRKPAHPKLQFAYLPSFHKLIVSADVGILGLDPKLAHEAKYLSAWFGPPGAGLIGRNTVPFDPDGAAKLKFDFPPLAEGHYDITMEIQDGAGKPLVTRKDTFEQKTFPFQSFKGGLEHEVVRPYTPIKAAPDTFETVGDRVKLTDTGLVAGIQSKLVPPAAGQNILAGPMTLVATQNGRTVTLGAADKPFAWTPSDLPTKISGSAQSHLAGLTFKLHGQADYTGQYLVNMDIVPNGTVSLDRLELRIPITDPADTCFAYTPRDSVVLYQKDHPWTGNPKPGELWNNLSQRSLRPYIMYVGDGERGLYWYTDSYEGYWIDPHKPHIFLVKTKDATELRIDIFNQPVVIDHPRHIRFAVMAVPTKPLPADAREMQWSNRMHIGGASWWGTIGVHVFPLNDEQWQNWIAGKPFYYKGKPYPGQCALLPNPPRAPDGRWLLVKGHEYGAYRAVDMIGYLQPENRVFSGEWTGVTNPAIHPDASLLGYKDDKGNPVWPLPEQRAILSKDPCVQSGYDFEAYYFYLLAKNTGAGGYWWDWGSLRAGSSMDKGEMYLDDEGRPQPRMNIFMVRAFYQRIARIVQDLGVPDTNNCYAPGAVYQVPWLSRMNAWESLYLESADDDMFSAWGVDRFRMQIGKFSGIPVQVVENIPINFTDPRARTVLAMALLHDCGVFGEDGDQRGMAILRRAGILDESAVWVPYWRSQGTATATQPGLLITAYQLVDSRRLTLVIVNPGPTDIHTDIVVPGARAGAKVVDDETQKPLNCAGDRVGGLTVKTHDFRLITLE